MKKKVVLMVKLEGPLDWVDNRVQMINENAREYVVVSSIEYEG